MMRWKDFGSASVASLRLVRTSSKGQQKTPRLDMRTPFCLDGEPFGKGTNQQSLPLAVKGEEMKKHITMPGRSNSIEAKDLRLKNIMGRIVQ